MKEIKFTLHLGVRFALLRLMPGNLGSMAESIEIMDFRKQLEPTPQEVKDVDIKPNEAGNISWDTEKDKGKTIFINENKKSILLKAFDIAAESDQVLSDPEYFRMMDELGYDYRAKAKELKDRKIEREKANKQAKKKEQS